MPTRYMVCSKPGTTLRSLCMQMYCGCGTPAGKCRWLAAIALATFGIAMGIMYGVEVRKCEICDKGADGTPTNCQVWHALHLRVARLSECLSGMGSVAASPFHSIRLYLMVKCAVLLPCFVVSLLQMLHVSGHSTSMM